MNPDVEVDVSNLPELPEGEWKIVLVDEQRGEDLSVFTNCDGATRWEAAADCGSLVPRKIIARPILKPLPCRWHKDKEPQLAHSSRHLRYNWKDKKFAVYCSGDDCCVGPWRTAEREAILAWNEMQADKQ